MSEKYSHLSKSKHTIPADSTSTINFLGAEPNYYQIVNGGLSDIYVGVSMMPTQKFYDAKIPGTSSKLVVDAYGHDEIYIYNPSSEDINIIVTSFEAEFNPTALALNGLGFDLSNVELSADVKISEFSCALPEGNNKIGKVELGTDEKKCLSGLWSAIVNNKTSDGSLIETIIDINNALCGNSGDDGKVKNVISLLEQLVNKEKLFVQHTQLHNTSEDNKKLDFNLQLENNQYFRVKAIHIYDYTGLEIADDDVTLNIYVGSGSGKCFFNDGEGVLPYNYGTLKNYIKEYPNHIIKRLCIENYSLPSEKVYNIEVIYEKLDITEEV